MIKQMQIPFDESHKGFLATIFFSVIGSLNIGEVSQIVFTLATLTTGTLTSIYTIKKIKQIDNEKNTKKH